MRLFLFLLSGCLVLAGAAAAGTATTGTGTVPTSPNAAEVAAYDAILAQVQPGQTTVALGDMILPVSTVQLWRNQLAGGIQSQSATNGVTLWTGGNVVYAFDSSVSAVHQADFLDAAGEWMAFANVHFIARTNQTNYVLVVDGGSSLEGGDSAVGMMGGMQTLDIGSTSWNRGTLLHEIGHLLGLIHEHQRSDRDTYVTIDSNNISGGATNGNFIKIPGSINNGAYDFLSIMHYSRNELAMNPALDTITPMAAYTQYINIMGNNPDRLLSQGDRAGMAIMYGPGPALSTTVTNTKDSGPGSLRTAIYYAFDLGGTPTISFQIPNTDPNFAGGVFTIKPSDHLPAPGPGTIIDGTTQTSFTGDTNPNGPEVVLNGVLQVSPDTYGLGLRLSAANVTVKGLVINGFSTQGILITGSGATGDIVEGCYIGTNPAGTAAVPNGFSGILISGGATGNTIGGTAAGTGNVISGNSAQGIYITDSGTGNNVIAGNWIGLNAAGTGAMPNAFAGVEIGVSAQGNTIGGTATAARNVISGNSSQGIYIDGSGTSNNMVVGNWIGLNAAGTGAVPNAFAGVEIGMSAQGNTIGGTATAARNVISGNASQGIYIDGSGTSGNSVLGNYVGLNAAGTAPFSNAFSGVAIANGATNNTIGGATATARNIISGNSSQGVYISNSGTTGNMIEGNWIGLNAAGTAAISNAFAGVEIGVSAQGNTIGGATAGSGNVISGNASQGIYINGSGTNSNVVEGNWIGLNAAGTAAVPNAFAGVEISGTAQNNIIGSTVAGTGNVISGNMNAGVTIDDPATINNRISANSIYANGWLGIDLGNNGVTANDTGDGDTGPNNLQNFPVLATAMVGATTTTVSGSLNSAANTTYSLEFFASAAGDPSGHGGGQTFFGTTSVTTDAGGNATFSTSLPVTVPNGQIVSATATDPAGNTSEFAQNVAVTITGLANWRLAWFGTTGGTGNAADLADPNGNGIPNLVEYALNGDPTGNTTGTSILPKTSRSGAQTLQLTFTRYLNRTDLTLMVQANDTLTGTWTNLAQSVNGAGFSVITTGTTVNETGTGNARSVTVGDIYLITDPAHPHRFMRLQVTGP